MQAKRPAPAPRHEPSGSSACVLTVSADSIAKAKPKSAFCDAELECVLRPGLDTITHASIALKSITDAIRIEEDLIQLRHPLALDALISALMELASNPHGAAMLASIDFAEG